MTPAEDRLAAAMIDLGVTAARAAELIDAFVNEVLDLVGMPKVRRIVASQRRRRHR